MTSVHNRFRFRTGRRHRRTAATDDDYSQARLSGPNEPRGWRCPTWIRTAFGLAVDFPKADKASAAEAKGPLRSGSTTAKRFCLAAGFSSAAANFFSSAT